MELYFLIVSGIYEYYINNKKKDIKQEELVKNDKSIQDELQKLKQELVLQKKIIQSYKTKESDKPKKICFMKIVNIILKDYQKK